MEQRSYTSEYRANAVKLARELGGSKAAKELRIPVDTLYTWISRARSGELPLDAAPTEPKKALNLAERVKELERENRNLRAETAQQKKEIEILEGATAFFVERRKKSANS